MSAFDKREEAFENKFRHDLELEFKIQARCARLVGFWAAGLLGYEGEEADAYAQSLVETRLQPDSRKAMVDQICHDFAAKDVEMSRHRVERRVDEIWQEARRQFMTS